MRKKKCRIENWSIIHDDEGLPFKLKGNIFGHPGGAEGAFGRSSKIVDLDVEAGVCETLNTTYELGVRDPEEGL